MDDERIITWVKPDHDDRFILNIFGYSQNLYTSDFNLHFINIFHQFLPEFVKVSSFHELYEEIYHGVKVGKKFPVHRIILGRNKKKEDETKEIVLPGYSREKICVFEFISRPQRRNNSELLVDYTQTFDSFFKKLFELRKYDFDLCYHQGKQLFYQKINLSMCCICKFNMFVDDNNLCSKCAVEHKKNIKDGGYVYIISDGDYYKIGKTNSFPSRRLKEISSCQPRDYKLVAFYFTSEISEVEKRLHNKFCKFKVKGEWFKFDHIRSQFFDACEIEFTIVYREENHQNCATASGTNENE